MFNVFAGELETRAMSQIGLTAMALGNHEFDKGSVNLEEQYQKFGGFPILAANYEFSDPSDPTQPKLDDIIHDWTSANVGGLKIGIIGLGNLSSIEGIIEGNNTLGVRPIDATQAITNAVSAVRSSVDLLVIASHLGLDEDEGGSRRRGRPRTRIRTPPVAVDGVDVIFGGHLHIFVLNPPKDLPHIDATDGHVSGHTVLCHSGAFAKYVGRLDLVVHIADPTVAGDKSGVKAYTYRIIPIDDSIPSDPAMDNLLELYQLKMNAFLNLTQILRRTSPARPTTPATAPRPTRNATTTAAIRSSATWWPPRCACSPTSKPTTA